MINRYKFAISYGFDVTLSVFLLLYSLWFMVNSGINIGSLSGDVILTPFIAFMFIAVSSLLSQILSKSPNHWSINIIIAATFVTALVWIIFFYNNLSYFSTFVLPVFSAIYLLLTYFITYRTGLMELPEGFVKESDYQIFYVLSAFLGFILVDAVVLTHTVFEIVAKIEVDIIIFFALYSLLTILLEVIGLYSVDSLRKVVRKFRSDLNVANFDRGMREIITNKLNSETLNLVYIRWALVFIDIDILEAIKIYQKTFEPHVMKYRRFYPLLQSSLALYSGEYDKARSIINTWHPKMKFLRIQKIRTTHFIRILENKEPFSLPLPREKRWKSVLDKVKNAVFLSVYYYNQKRFSDSKNMEEYAKTRIQRLPSLSIILHTRSAPLPFEVACMAKKKHHVTEAIESSKQF